MPRSCSSFETVRVNPCQGSDKGAFAVVDVSGRPDYDMPHGFLFPVPR